MPNIKNNLNINYIIFLFLLIPFSQTVPIITISGREVNLGLDTILIAIIILYYIANNSALNIITTPLDPLSLLIILLALCYSLSLIAALRYLTASQFMDCFLVLIKWAQYIPIYFLIININKKVNNYNKFIYILMLSGLIISIWGIYEIMTTTRTDYFRGAVTFTKPMFRESDLDAFVDETGYHGSANYNVAAAYLLICFTMSMPFLLSNFFKISMLNRAAILALLITGVFATYSRSGAVALIMSIVYVLFCSYRKLLYFLVSSFAVALFSSLYFDALKDLWLISTFVELVAMSPDIIPLVLGGAHTWESSMGVTTNVFGAVMRFVAYLKAFDTFLESPLYGCGFYAFKYANPDYQTAENYFLQTLAETGVMGLILLLVIIFRLWKLSSFNKEITFNNNYKIGFRALLISMVIVNMTGTMFYVQKVWGPFLMLCAILLRISNEKKYYV